MQPIDEVIEVLLIKEKELKRELRFLEETRDNYLKYIDRYTKMENEKVQFLEITDINLFIFAC